MPRPKPGQEKQKPRPRIGLDWDKIDHRLFCQISGEKIAAEFGINPATLYERCKQEKGMSWLEYMATKKSNGQAAILAAQFEKAIKFKDGKLLVHLGQIYCDQIVKQQIEHSGNVTIQRVDYSTASLADLDAANAQASAIPDTSVELFGQGGQEGGYCVAPTSRERPPVLELHDN